MSETKKRRPGGRIAIIMTLLLAATSCGDSLEESASYMKPSPDVPEVIMRLRAFNDSLGQECGATRGESQCRQISEIAVAGAEGAYAGSGKIGKFAATLGADYQQVGSRTGGVVIGSAMSYKRYLEIEHVNYSESPTGNSMIFADRETFAAGYAGSKDKFQPADYALGISCGLDSCSTRIGILHNKVLDEIKQIEILGNQEDLISQLDVSERLITGSDEFKTVYEGILSGAVNTFIHRATSDEVMALFVAAVRDAGEDLTRILRIISTYASVVTDTPELSDDDKQCLYKSFAVAGYSYEYWMEKLSSGGEKTISRLHHRLNYDSVLECKKLVSRRSLFLGEELSDE